MNIAGFERQTIRRYQNGERSPILKNIVKLTEALNVTPDYLVDLAYLASKK